MATPWTGGYLESVDPTYSIPVSSVAGLSRSILPQSRTLRELLGALGKSALQPFKLSELEYGGALGEGISYKVTRHVGKHDGKVYAVKEIKLPVGLKPLQRHIACVLRDVEVMSRLAAHTNVMGIYGWGWNARRGGSIPFLVTEYAEYGTLRQFLSKREISVYDKLVLCRDVAQALQSLHEADIAHGDLKLDNILVTPAQADQERSCKVSARVSDFGHALSIPAAGEENISNRTYGGTIAYNPPEVLQPKTEDCYQVDFVKCDIWSFGLLCWEALDDGRYYHKSAKVHIASMSNKRTVSGYPASGKPSVTIGSGRDESNSSLSAGLVPSQSTGTIMKQDVHLVAPYLADIACEELREAFGEQLTQRELDKLCGILQSCLQVEVRLRAGKVTDLSLLPKHQSSSPADCLVDEAEESPVDAWSFDIFRVAYSMPQVAKARLLEENVADALEWGRSSASARAAFQAALACIERFGTPENLPEARRWLSVSAAKGFPLGSDIVTYIQASLESLSPNRSVDELHEIFNWDFAKFVRMGFTRKVSDTLSPALLSAIPDTARQLSKTMMKMPSSAVFSPNRETLLQLSFKLGRHGLVKWLLEQQNFPWIFDRAGCGPLHWLFMFTREEMEQIVEALMLCEDAKIHVQKHVNALSTVEEVLDPQLPVCLSGTPLEFATAAGSETAIKCLLGFGADPLFGLTYPRKWVRSQAIPRARMGLSGSALHIACKYHNCKALKLYFSKAFAQMAPNERCGLQRTILHFCTGAYSSATRTERLMYHGHNARRAAKDTATLLLTLNEEIEPNGLYMYRFLQPAILRGDLDAAYGILSAVEQSGSKNFRSHLHPQERRMLVFHCVQEACTGNHDVEVVHQMLEFAIAAGSDINCKDFGLKTKRPINFAIQHRDKVVFDWLVSHGADLNALDPHGLSALHHMISSNFFTMYDVADIIKLGASTKLRDDQGLDTLSFATVKGDAKVLKSLIRCERELGLSPRIEDLLMTAIVFATKAKELKKGNPGPNVDVITTILDEAEEAQEVLIEPLQYALTQACQYGWMGVVRILLARGCPHIPEVGSDRPPLFVAASHGHVDIVRALLDAGADPNYRSSAAGTEWLDSVLFWSTANHSGVYKCVESIVKEGADVTFHHLELTVQKPRPPNWQDLAQLLLDKGVGATQRRDIWISDALETDRYDVDLATFIVRSGTLLPTASEENNATLQLLTRRPPANPDDSGTLTSLYHLTRTVINTGCKIFRIDENGNTPLQNSLEYRNTAVFSAILEEHRNFGHPDLKVIISNMPLTVLLLQKRVRERQGREKDELLNWALLRSCWLKSVRLEFWHGVVSFLTLGIVGPTRRTSWMMSEVFNEGRARRFLRWAMNPPFHFQREVAEALALFFGTSDMCPPDIRLPRKDDHLAAMVERLSLDEEEMEKISVFREMGGYAPERTRALYFEEGRAKGSQERNMIVFVGIDYGRNPPPPNQISILFEDEVERERDATLENLQLLGSFGSSVNRALTKQPPTPSYHLTWAPGSISGDDEKSSRYRAITSFFYDLPPWKRTLLFREWRRRDGSLGYLVQNWERDCKRPEGRRLIRLGHMNSE